jgi:hypothetical protein
MIKGDIDHVREAVGVDLRCITGHNAIDTGPTHRIGETGQFTHVTRPRQDRQQPW